MTSDNAPLDGVRVADVVNGAAFADPLDDVADDVAEREQPAAVDPVDELTARFRRTVASVDHIQALAFLSDDPVIDLHPDVGGGPGLVLNIGRAVTLFGSRASFAAIRDAIDARLLAVGEDTPRDQR